MSPTNLSRLPMLKYIVVAALLALASGHASAQITVNRSIVEFTDTTRVQDIEVFNSGKQKIFLEMNVAEIIEPESAEPQRKEFDDPRAAPVLVSPRQLLVPPGTRKRVRVILRESPGNEEHVYRLRVSPYTGKAKLAAVDGDKKASAIRVLIGYDLLLLARPTTLSPDVEVTRTDDAIEFRNTGNTNVLLRRIVQCDAGTDPDDDGADKNCNEMQPNRLYVGETYSVDLPKKGSADRYPVKVWQAVGLENSSDLF